MSHSPLMDRNRAQPDTEKRFNAALKKAQKFAANLEPDLTVIFHPDHVNGFFYKLLPSFCVGIEGTSVGDFGTVAGKLDIPEDLAMDCAEHVLKDGVDTAISYRMEVDHGATQPVELLSDERSLARMIPIFINCATPPRPSFDRVRALGAAVGRWAESRPERILILGSGGLSHDPPIPALATAPHVRQRLIEGGTLGHEARLARQNAVMGEGAKLVDGTSKLLPLDPEWDQMLLDGFSSGNLKVLDDMPDDVLTATGGRGGHEVRAWVAALAAMGPNYKSDVLFYEVINEWLTGMGVMTATPA
ncbi:MAG: 3-carboxyethylcatechol 2,3-dioxygenase [Marinosulfonomonas sp.]|nr:3-carboxyethylcatechol 2,3-dioxygenase [Marinosulfonomonas sp.]